MKWLGDIAEDAVLDFKFSTHKTDGTPITLAGSPALSVYKANSTTETTTGVTLTVDFDGKTGCHHVRIDTSDAFYAVANDYEVVITTGTVDSISVVGTVLGGFSIENRFAEVDVVKITGSAEAAVVLAVLNGSAIARGIVNAVTTSGNFTLTSAGLVGTDDDYNDMLLLFTSGSNKYVMRVIGDYTGTDNKRVQFTGTGLRGAFPRTVAPADTWLLLGGAT